MATTFSRIVVSKNTVTAVIAALVALQFFFVAAYVLNEHTIYFWDHNMYLALASAGSDAFANGFGNGWDRFYASLGGDYNLIFAIPSFVSFSLFSPSRLVFILTNFTVYFLVYEIAIASVLHRALKIKWSLSLIIALAACSLVPPLWVPLFEGYPDVGAAACVVFALGLFFPLDRQLKFRRALGIGLLLGLAVLLRRHYVYSAIALLIVAASTYSLSLWRGSSKKDRLGALGRVVLLFVLSGTAMTAVIALVAPRFLWRAMTTNYNALYLSYKKPPLEFLQFSISAFGIGLLAVAVSGLYWMKRKDGAGHRLAQFISAWTALWLVIWCAGPDQMGHHYVQQMLPVIVIVGICGWMVYLDRLRQKRALLWCAALGLGLIANSAWALWFSPELLWANNNGPIQLYSSPRPPPRRTDYDELVRMATYLQNATSADDRLFVIGSSFVFNADILHSLYNNILGAPGMAARFVVTPEIDHEQAAPLDSFSTANVYIVAEPAQYHLDPAGQKVVTAAVNQFPPPLERSGLFHEDDEKFELMQNVMVHVWRRDDWRPAMLHDTLQQIRRDGPEDVVHQQDWVALTQPWSVQISTTGQNSTSALGLFSHARPQLSLFFDYPLEGGEYRLTFVAATDGRCTNPLFHIDAMNGRGKAVSSRDLVPEEGSGRVSQNVSLPATSEDKYFLQLDLHVDAAAICNALIQELRVTRL